MVNLLALWRAHGLDEILREAWQAGIVLAGLSAGSMCWFECGVTKSVGRPSLGARARLPARLELGPLRRRAGPPARSTSTRSRAASSPPAGASTTAPGCCSAARAWPRRWRRGGARGPTGYTRSTARRSRRRSSRACSRRGRTRTRVAARGRRDAGAATPRAAGGAGTEPPRVRGPCDDARPWPRETLSPRQLNRATLARQGLLERERVGVVEAVERFGPLQAQDARPPFIGLWSRVEGFDRGEALTPRSTTAASCAPPTSGRRCT